MNNIDLTYYHPMENIEDILQELRGSYSTSFYSIYLDGTYDADLSKMTQRDQGTLLHEYIHFLQNISTPWGMRLSQYIYSCMTETLHELVTQNEVAIPVKIQVDQTLSQQIGLAYGTSKLKTPRASIDWSKGIGLFINEKDINGKKYEIPVFRVALNTGGTEDLEIGGLVVMETMASLYQSLIDPNASHPDVPYNLIVRFCQQYYPSLAADTRKLICLYYVSLVASFPGTKLIDLIKRHGNDNLDGYQVFQKFVKDTPDMVIAVDNMINQFKQLLRKILHSDLDYLAAIFEPVKLSSEWVPVVTALYDKEPFDLGHFQTMISQIGMPYLHTSCRQYSFPNGIGKGEASLDLVELIGLQTVYRYFRTPKGSECECGLSYMCRGEKIYDETRCKKTPWSRDMRCPFSQVASWFGLDKKVVKREK